MKKHLLLFLLCLTGYITYGQGSTLEDATAFCASGSSLTYPNTCSGAPPEPGINYGCLGSQPDGGWFYVQIDAPGTLDFQISQVTNGGTPIDVDYIAWGPFTLNGVPPTMPTPGQLNSAPVPGCSYSTAATETLTINNNIGNQFYVILITNYNGQCGQITLTQTNAGQPGAGTTNCDIVCPTSMSPDAIICPNSVSIISISTTASAPVYQWSDGNGPISGATGPTYQATQPGTYCVHMTSVGCVPQDKCVTISAPTPAPISQPPTDLMACGPLPVNFDLTQNNLPYLGLPPSYSIDYFESQTDAQDASNPISNPGAYPGTDGQVIWISVFGPNDECFSTFPFTLIINAPPATPDPSDITVCDSYTLPALPAGQTYHSAPGGTAGTVIPVGTVLTASQTIYILAETGTIPNCTAEGDFILTISTPPIAPNPADVTACDSYTLPALPVGQSYHSVPGGGGTVLTGNITTSQTVYVLAETGINCTAEGDFFVTINNTPATPNPSDITACDSYTLPALPSGLTYHSATGGAGGTLIPVGTVLITSQTIYVFAETGTVPNCTAEGDFIVTINTTPATPSPSDVTACDSYTLPGLPVGSTYHSAPGGGGTVLSGNITASQTIYVFAETGTTPNCTAEGDFIVTINTTPATPSPSDVTACDSYTLPGLPVGSTYHSAPGGGGTVLSGNITASQTIYVFAETGTVPNCTAEGDFIVTINTTPATPSPSDVTACDSYTLPGLPSGQSYHSAPGGDAGTSIPVGTVLTTSQTVYVFAETGTSPTCTAEGDFLVTVNYTPVPDAPADVVACDSYTLPVLSVGNYFDGPNGTGNAYAPGDVISLSITMYVYAQTGTTPNCIAQNSFTIGIFHSPAIVAPTPLDVCDDNNDGFSCLLDLTTKTNGITAGQPLMVTYHETAADAQSGANPIPSPAAYCNISPGLQTVYVRVSDPAAPQCAAFTTLELHVNRVPVASTIISDYHMCDLNNPGDLVEGFDLPTMDSDVVQAGQSGIEVSYYLTLTDAQAGTNPIDTTSPYYNTSTPQQIWVHLEDATTGCFTTASFSLVVDPLPAITPLADMNACSTGATNTASFDLTTNDVLVSGGVPGMSVSYYLTLGDAQNEVNPLVSPYTNITNPQTIYVRVEDVVTTCPNTTSLVLNVTQGPPAFAPDPLEACDDNDDGFATFDLESANTQVAGGAVPAGVSITYHETSADAQSGANPWPSPYTNISQGGQIMYVRIFYAATGCANYTQLQLIVHHTPVAHEPVSLVQCDTNGDGISSFDLTGATPQVLGDDLDPGEHTVSYYVLQADAQAGTNAITNVLGFVNTTPNLQTIWVRVEYNTTHCFDVVPLDLTVYPSPLTPAAGFVSPYSLCDNDNPGDQIEVFDLTTKIPVDILNGQTGMDVTFYLTGADAQSGANPIPNPASYTNISNAQTLFVRIENALTGCFSITTMDLRVEPLPAPIPQDPLAECDPDGDGFTVFDLDALVADLIQGDPNMAITFHPTALDAENGVNAIGPADTAAYHNIVPYFDHVYVRAENTLTHCHSVLAIELDAIASPQMPALTDLTACDEDANTQNGFTAFDLTGQDATILSAQSGAASDYTISYYLSEADAMVGNSPIIPPANYVNIMNPQTIWVVVGDVNGECRDIGSFRLVVSTPLALPAATQLSICDDGPASATPTAAFDLTLEDAYYTGGASGYTVQYYVSSADAHANTNAIPTPASYTNTSNAQTIYVAVTGPGPSVCRSYSTLTLRVLPLPVPLAIGPDRYLVACDDVNSPDGTELFDLTVNEAYISNGASFTFLYYTSQADANAQTNPIATPTAYEVGTGSIWIRVMNNQPDFSGDFCYVVVEEHIVVNPLPIVAVNPVIDQQCDGNADGFEQFDLLEQQYVDIILGTTQSPADFTLSYYLTQADAQAGIGALGATYTNTANPQDIYVRIVNNATGCVNAMGVVTLSVAAGATSATPAAVFLCDDNTDGVANGYDLTQFSPEVLGTQDGTLFTVTYYPTLVDAQTGTNAITTPNSYDTPTADLYAVVTNNATFCPSPPVLVSITVEALADPVIGGGHAICVEYPSGTLLSSTTLTITNADTDHTYEWFLDADPAPIAAGTTYTATAEGSYTVVATSVNGCISVSSQAFVVVKSGPPVPVGTGYTVTNAFSDNQTITIQVEGYGHYVYALDDGPFLDNGGVFQNVGPGVHTVRVIDIDNACAEMPPITLINAIDYPPYFTPNGDGIHDTWNIWSLSDQPSTKIYIFDRYGKLIKQISPQGLGWDGTFNGKPLPSTDYWFTVYYPEAGTTKEFKAHFSLKR
jgi:gliding motility-associated-like protein